MKYELKQILKKAFATSLCLQMTLQPVMLSVISHSAWSRNPDPENIPEIPTFSEGGDIPEIPEFENPTDHQKKGLFNGLFKRDRRESGGHTENEARAPARDFSRHQEAIAQEFAQDPSCGPLLNASSCASNVSAVRKNLDRCLVNFEIKRHERSHLMHQLAQSDSRSISQQVQQNQQPKKRGLFNWGKNKGQDIITEEAQAAADDLPQGSNAEGITFSTYSFGAFSKGNMGQLSSAERDVAEHLRISNNGYINPLQQAYSEGAGNDGHITQHAGGLNRVNYLEQCRKDASSAAYAAYVSNHWKSLIGNQSGSSAIDKQQCEAMINKLKGDLGDYSFNKYSQLPESRHLKKDNSDIHHYEWASKSTAHDATSKTPISLAVPAEHKEKKFPYLAGKKLSESKCSKGSCYVGGQSLPPSTIDNHQEQFRACSGAAPIIGGAAAGGKSGLGWLIGALALVGIIAAVAGGGGDDDHGDGKTTGGSKGGSKGGGKGGAVTGGNNRGGAVTGGSTDGGGVNGGNDDGGTDVGGDDGGGTDKPDPAPAPPPPGTRTEIDDKEGTGPDGPPGDGTRRDENYDEKESEGPAPSGGTNTSENDDDKDGGPAGGGGTNTQVDDDEGTAPSPNGAPGP